MTMTITLVHTKSSFVVCDCWAHETIRRQMVSANFDAVGYSGSIFSKINMKTVCRVRNAKKYAETYRTDMLYLPLRISHLSANSISKVHSQLPTVRSSIRFYVFISICDVVIADIDCHFLFAVRFQCRVPSIQNQIHLLWSFPFEINNLAFDRMRTGVRNDSNSLSTALCTRFTFICYRLRIPWIIKSEVLRRIPSGVGMGRMAGETASGRGVYLYITTLFVLISQSVSTGPDTEARQHIYAHLLARGMRRGAIEHWLFSDVFTSDICCAFFLSLLFSTWQWQRESLSFLSTSKVPRNKS